jgi:site-specific DNA-methyltransferase (adenine-specific)
MNAKRETDNQPAHHRIIFGDSRSMREAGDRSVHLIVTSPPYWQLKDYDNKAQIGFHDSYEEYINNLNLVWAECHRVLHDGCRLCINIGDQFARSVYYGRYKIIPIRTEIIRFCETIGLDYMGAIIWQKVTTCNTTGGGTVMGSFPYPRNGILKLDYEFILLFKKPGKPPKVSREIKEKAALTTEEWNTYFSGHWRFSGAKQNKHLAAFPAELPRRLIRMFTFPGETVLDPFLGSGTTSVAAQECGRRSIGYEIDRENAHVILERLGSDAGSLFGNSGIEIISPAPDQVFDCEAAYRSLPYLFRDPVRLERKSHAEARTFGSKVSPRTPEREEYYTVQRIIAPNLIELRDGPTIRLLGVSPLNTRRTEAMRYLKDLVDGQKIYLRFDQTRHDRDGRTLGYMYLSNRTFVNARLIKAGLAGIDEEFPFEKANLFQRYHNQVLPVMDR